MGEIYWTGVIAVAIMYAAFLIVGWLAARKVHEGTPADLLVAGRNMPLWIATLTMTATWVDGGYLLGTAEGTFSNLASGIQGGLCFGVSLILGGIFFAKKMRKLEFTTLIDPFERRFGKRWAAVLFVPALFGELIWSGALLVAIGATFGVILDMDLTAAILISALVVTAYTMVGGMWSVAYTDAFQLALIPLGLLIALPFALDKVGGLSNCVNDYLGKQGLAAQLLPPLDGNDEYWTAAKRIAWWDLSAMLVFGGIPWNCYFARVLSCQTPVKARWHSICAGVMTIALTLPPLLLGMAAFLYAGWPDDQAPVGDDVTKALPLLLRYMVPAGVGLVGLAAIIGAVTSSFSSSILSAGAMSSWNVYRPLLHPAADVRRMKLVIRGAIVLFAALAVVLALKIPSVKDLWFFCADLVFVLLFPQLVMALFDPKTNRIGSMTAFGVSLFLRLGAGEPLLELPGFLDYAETFPYRSAAALVGLVLLPVVSRLTARWDPPATLEEAGQPRDLSGRC